MASVTQDTKGKGLGFAFFAGPVLWGVQLLVGYVLANLVSSGGLSRFWYYLLSAVVVLAILAAGVVAVVNWRRMSGNRRPDIVHYEEPASRAEFVATSGLFLSGIFFLLALATGVFVIFINPARMITQPFP
jgi:hypothetical protein